MSTTFVYNRLDFILPWYLDDYVELDRAQETFLDAQLQPFLAWHRSEELPRYTQILDDIARRLDGPLTGQDVAAISLEFEQAWFRLEGRSLEWLLALGERLTEEQVQQFLDELWEQQEEYRKNTWSVAIGNIMTTVMTVCWTVCRTTWAAWTSPRNNYCRRRVMSCCARTLPGCASAPPGCSGWG